MLRTTALALLAANVAFWAYAQGHLGALGLPAHADREPQRLAQQVAPGTLVVRNAGLATPTAAPETAPGATPPGATDTDNPDAPPAPDTAPPAEAAPTTAAAPASTRPAPATACWQATGLNENLAPLLRGALNNQPELAERWSLNPTVLPARWIVYLGKFPNAEALQRRRAELREARIDHREVNTPALQPGLALGTYSSEDAARRALADLKRQGTGTARVVQERPESRQFTLLLPSITEAQRRRIASLDLLGGRPLQPCP